jgi:hypothetical protein
MLVIVRDVGLEEMVRCCGLSKVWTFVKACSDLWAMH